jgi:hypothetical protein
MSLLQTVQFSIDTQTDDVMDVLERISRLKEEKLKEE